MARWRLTAAHYLNVPGTKYRYEETDRDTGETSVTEFPVPRLLDPKDPPAQSRRLSGGEIIVCYGAPTVRGDFQFEGPPTPDMDPLDDEAQAISDEHRPNWVHPIDNMPEGMEFGAAILKGLEAQIDRLFKAGGGVSPGTVGVSKDQFDALAEQVKSLIEQNAALQEALAKKPEGRRL